jgi:hypothetical protein
LKKVKEIFFVFGTKNNIIIIITNNKNMKKKIPLMGKDKTILGASLPKNVQVQNRHAQKQ